PLAGQRRGRRDVWGSIPRLARITRHGGVCPHTYRRIRMSNDSKYNKAVNQATGGGSEEKAVAIGEAAAMFSTFETKDLQALAATGQFEFAPQVMTLEVGQKIEGILEGMGPGNDFEDKDTGIVRHVDSWIIASLDGSLRVSILSSAQLDKK